MRCAPRLVMAALLIALGGGVSGSAAGDMQPQGAVEVEGSATVRPTAGGMEATFVGGGFTGGSVVRVSVDGKPSTQLRSTARGAFLVRMPIDQPHRMTASGVGPAGRPRVVHATITSAQLAQVRRTAAVEAGERTQDLYVALGGSLAAIVIFVLGLTGFRVRDRARPAR